MICLIFIDLYLFFGKNIKITDCQVTNFLTLNIDKCGYIGGNTDHSLNYYSGILQRVYIDKNTYYIDLYTGWKRPLTFKVFNNTLALYEKNNPNNGKVFEGKDILDLEKYVDKPVTIYSPANLAYITFLRLTNLTTDQQKLVDQLKSYLTNCSYYDGLIKKQGSNLLPFNYCQPLMIDIYVP